MSIWDLAKPVIAQVHGYCLAGGSELATGCDLVYMADDAQMGYPAVRFGVPDMHFHPWFLGMRKAMEMMMTGDSVSGIEAVRYGWANAAFPADELEAEVLKVAEKISKLPLDLLQLNKRAIHRQMEVMGLRAGIRAGTELCALGTHTQSMADFVADIQSDGSDRRARSPRQQVRRLPHDRQPGELTGGTRRPVEFWLPLIFEPDVLQYVEVARCRGTDRLHRDRAARPRGDPERVRARASRRGRSVHRQRRPSRSVHHHHGHGGRHDDPALHDVRVRADDARPVHGGQAGGFGLDADRRPLRARDAGRVGWRRRSRSWGRIRGTAARGWTRCST